MRLFVPCNSQPVQHPPEAEQWGKNQGISVGPGGSQPPHGTPQWGRDAARTQTKAERAEERTGLKQTLLQRMELLLWAATKHGCRAGAWQPSGWGSAWDGVVFVLPLSPTPNSPFPIISPSPPLLSHSWVPHFPLFLIPFPHSLSPIPIPHDFPFPAVHHPHYLSLFPLFPIIPHYFPLLPTPHIPHFPPPSFPSSLSPFPTLTVPTCNATKPRTKAALFTPFFHEGKLKSAAHKPSAEIWGGGRGGEGPTQHFQMLIKGEKAENAPFCSSLSAGRFGTNLPPPPSTPCSKETPRRSPALQP